MCKKSLRLQKLQWKLEQGHLRKGNNIYKFTNFWVSWENTPETERFRPLKMGHVKRKGSSSNHHFSGDMLVFGGVVFSAKLVHMHQRHKKKEHNPPFEGISMNDDYILLVSSLFCLLFRLITNID